MDKKIVLPIYLKEIIKPLKRSFPKKYKMLVCDVETAQGEPYLLTLFDGERAKYIKVTPETIEHEFIKYLTEKCKQKNCSYILFFHNIEFDLPAIFTLNEDMFEYLSPPIFETFDPTGTKLAETKIYAQKVWFASVKLKNGVRVKLVDSARFINGSLYDISRRLNLKHKKPKRPKGVEEGKEIQSLKDNVFKSYVKNEIYAEYDLANFIIDMHKSYDTNFCVSSSQLSSKVFKKRFLKEPIPQIPFHIKGLAERSLHGGRTGYFLNGIAVIPDVKLYDYNSFYPFALFNLPPLTKGKWEKVTRFVDEYEGFYRVSGFVQKCKYPIIIKYSKGFTYANNERIENVAVASYELREALRSKEIQISKITGYVWIPSKDSVNPFKDFVKEFFDKKKSTPKDEPMYVTYKLLLNQLYGKTYQTVRLTDYEETTDYEYRNGRLVKSEIVFRAGGLYLPHVGSWITSMCRAILHKTLYDFEAISCATDSFMTKKEAKEGDDLGELKKECEGLLLMIRPKVYVIFSKEVQEEVLKVGDLRTYLRENLDDLEVGKDIVKYATHGFWGNVKELLRLYVEKKHDHEVMHMTKIRESLKQHKQPRVMEKQKRKINVNWDNEIGLCGLKKKKAVKEMELCSSACFTCAYA